MSRRLLVAAFLFAVTFALRIGIVVGTNYPYKGESSESENVAITLATRGEFADAFGQGSGPTAHLSPLFPLLLSVPYRLAGDVETGRFLRVVLQIILTSLLVVSIFLVARHFVGSVAALTAALFAAVIPLYFWTEVMGLHENVLAGLVLLLFLGVLWRDFKHGQRPIPGTLTSVLLGVACLTSATLLLPGLAAISVAIVQKRQNVKITLARLLICLAIVILMLFPWAYRNHKVLGKWIWFRSNFGLELNLGYFEGTVIAYNHFPEAAGQRHPYSNELEGLKYRQLGEVEYNRQKLQEALGYIQQRPLRALTLTARRFFAFWMPPTVRAWQKAVQLAILLMSIVGLYLLIRSNRASGLVLLGVLFTYALPYCLVQIIARYQYPVYPLLLLTASYSVYFYLVNRGWIQRFLPISVNRWLAGLEA